MISFGAGIGSGYQTIVELRSTISALSNRLDKAESALVCTQRQTLEMKEKLECWQKLAIAGGAVEFAHGIVLRVTEDESTIQIRLLGLETMESFSLATADIYLFTEQGLAKGDIAALAEKVTSDQVTGLKDPTTFVLAGGQLMYIFQGLHHGLPGTLPQGDPGCLGGD